MNEKMCKPSHHLELPAGRVKVIMKSSPDVEHISPDALYAMTKATELFVAHLSNETFNSGTGNQINYKGLADVVNNDDMFGFLQEVIPHKITVREYWKLNNKSETDDSDEDSESSDSSN